MEIEALEPILCQMASDNSEIITHLINIEQGLQYLLYIAVAFLVWKVITVLYRLFGGVFFGGI
jgi:hypothetical protein